MYSANKHWKLPLCGMLLQLISASQLDQVCLQEPSPLLGNGKEKKTFMAPRHQNCTPLLQQLHWLPISEQIKYKTACMCYNAITGSAPSYLFELLHLYSHSRSLCSSSDTCMLKIQRFNRKTHGFHIFSHFGSHI